MFPAAPTMVKTYDSTRQAPAVRVATVLMAFTCGCASSSTAPNAGPPPPVDLGPVVTFGFADGRRPDFGELARVRISVANGHIQPIVVRAIDLADQLPEKQWWLGSKPGRIQLELERRVPRCFWFPRADGHTPPIFSQGLLFPGEVLELDRWVRVRSFSQDLTVRYQVVPHSDFRTPVFLPDRLNEKNPHRQVFEPASITEVSAYRALRPGAPERLVCVPQAGDWLVERKSFHFVVQCRDPETPEDVLARVDLAGAEVSWWDYGQAWLVRTPHDRLLHLYRVDDDGAEPEVFSRVDFDAFDLVDASVRDGFELLVLRPAPAEGDEPVEDSDEASETTADTMDALAPEEFLDLLRAAGADGLRVSVETLDPDLPTRETCLVLR